MLSGLQKGIQSSSPSERAIDQIDSSASGCCLLDFFVVVVASIFGRSELGDCQGSSLVLLRCRFRIISMVPILVRSRQTATVVFRVN